MTLTRLAAAALVAAALALPAPAKDIIADPSLQPQAPASTPAPAPTSSLPVADAPPPVPRATITAEAGEAGIGEPLRLRIVLPRPVLKGSIEAALPKEQSGLALLGRVDEDANGSYVDVRVLKDGDQTLGPFAIKAADEAGAPLAFEGAAITFSIRPPVHETAAERDFTAPVALPYDWTLRNILIVAAIAVLLLVALAIGALIGRRRTIGAAENVPPPLPPVIEAQRALGELARLKVFEGDGPEAHYTALSMLLRRYVERQYHVPALEMTDDEMVDFMRRQIGGRPGAAALPEVFTRSSAAKYAREALTRDTASTDCGTVGIFLDAEYVRIERERLAAEQAARSPGRPAVTSSAPGTTA